MRQDGGSRIFALFDGSCHELFRVIYNGGALNGTGVSPQGIITAYYSSTGTTTAAAPLGPSVTTTATTYRTDCRVVQTI